MQGKGDTHSIVRARHLNGYFPSQATQTRVFGFAARRFMPDKHKMVTSKHHLPRT